VDRSQTINERWRVIKDKIKMIENVPIRSFILDDEFETIVEHLNEHKYRCVYSLKEVVGEG